MIDMSNNDDNIENDFKKCTSKNGTPDEIRNRVMTDDYEDCYRNLDPSELTTIANIVFSTNASTMTNEQETKLKAHQALLKDVLNEIYDSPQFVKQLIEKARAVKVAPVAPVAPVSTAPASTVKVAPVASNVTRKAVNNPSYFNQLLKAKKARNEAKAAANAANAANIIPPPPPGPPPVNTQANENEEDIPPPPVNTQAIEYARQKANQTAKAAKQREQEVEGARAAGDAAQDAAQDDIEKRKEDLGIISAIEARLALGNPKKLRKLKKNKKIITAELAVELAVKKAEQAKIAAAAQLAQAQSQQSNAQRREKEALAKFKQLAPVQAEAYAASAVKEAERARLEAGTNASKEAKAEAIALGNKVPASTTTTSTIAATAITAANTTASTAARAKVEVKPVPTNSKLIRITRDKNGIFHKEIVTPGSNPKSIDGESRLFRLTREGGTYKIEQVPLLTRNIPPLTRNHLYNGPVNTAYSYKGGRRTKKRK